MRDSIKKSNIYDVIGIGIGPFNLGFAALAEGVPEIDALFFEKKPQFDWHPGMMIEGTTLQVPFLADLVSMADVTNRYSFLNYLQEKNRLYRFYFREDFHIPRKEYNHYCRWVTEQLDNCHFHVNVKQVELQTIDGEDVYEIVVEDVRTKEEDCYYSRHILMGIGTVPAVPEQLQEALGEKVFHTADYLYKKNICKGAEKVTVIGSGQSAAEVFLDLLEDQPDHVYSLDWYTRSKGFFPMEYSKLGLEHFSPDYTSFFYQLAQAKKDKLLNEQDLLYKGISAETISDIYELLYQRSVGEEEPDIHLQAMSAIKQINPVGEKWRLYGCQLVSEEEFLVETDVVILGTGYKSNFPDFLMPVHDLIIRDSQGRFSVCEDYKLSMDGIYNNHIFIQNGEIHTHGVGAPDLGLGAHRNAVIINSLAGRDVYPVSQVNVYQSFGTRRQPAFSQ
ncbi:lysine N(6)-hydroxylase/L-ornithine N(5)-oxygenase family protein [Thalassobacillus devorans]|uniref:lysine N(6)-hydroxylase/L-ornithine N(5)-oxygenase family protein n=1 Tax=Thalassobacillus devorans TaxID=279813 RepID=UPI000A1C7F43|nr:lysine N(6)-hydroxylase/L-ornithine N(5)-oxygenase family protein [Thalassobacillus devorans]